MPVVIGAFLVSVKIIPAQVSITANAATVSMNFFFNIYMTSFHDPSRGHLNYTRSPYILFAYVTYWKISALNDFLYHFVTSC